MTDWTTIASTTIVKNGGKVAGASAVWFSYTSLAVYDAVNAITGPKVNNPAYFFGQMYAMETNMIPAPKRFPVDIAKLPVPVGML